jgi:hypothetical protein
MMTMWMDLSACDTKNEAGEAVAMAMYGPQFEARR